MKTEYITEFALIEMFRRVGLDMPDVETIIKWAEERGPDWFWTETWTEEEQEDFRSWLYKFLARNTRWSARMRQKECAWFMLMWGWKTKENNNVD